MRIVCKRLFEVRLFLILVEYRPTYYHHVVAGVAQILIDLGACTGSGCVIWLDVRSGAIDCCHQ